VVASCGYSVVNINSTVSSLLYFNSDDCLKTRAAPLNFAPANLNGDNSAGIIIAPSAHKFWSDYIMIWNAMIAPLL
jgi:hypothetical protein